MIEPIDARYARQSLDKQDSISIENQIEFCKYETHGGSYETYIDKGFSGKIPEYYFCLFQYAFEQTNLELTMPEDSEVSKIKKNGVSDSECRLAHRQKLSSG